MNNYHFWLGLLCLSFTTLWALRLAVIMCVMLGLLFLFALWWSFHFLTWWVSRVRLVQIINGCYGRLILIKSLHNAVSHYLCRLSHMWSVDYWLIITAYSCSCSISSPDLSYKCERSFRFQLCVNQDHALPDLTSTFIEPSLCKCS